MLNKFYLRESSHRLVRIYSRVNLSTLPQTKSSEIDGTVVPNSSNVPKSDNIKLSTTLVLPGVPVNPSPPPLASEPLPPIKEQQQPEQVSSSGFLGFFRTKNNYASTVNIATTREHFIPLTRPSLIRLLATDNQLLDDIDDRLLFHELCEGFDSAVIQRYHPVLNELKTLFNPLNPDNETIDNQTLTYRDRLDNEYWLLQKIDELLHRSNFTELPRNILLEKFIIQNDSSSASSSSINVKINGYDYDVLKFWILGREQIPIEEQSTWKRLFRKAKSIFSSDYFKRVIVAVRLKGQDRLYLKAFRDIPLQNLPQLLPIGKLQIGSYEQRLIRLTFLTGTMTAVTHLITTMADFYVPGLVIGGSSLTLLFALWSYRSSFRSKISYLSSMNRVLFYKNIASNKQLLAMIIDRAEDELSKEILLTYIIILWRQKQNADLTQKILELEIENWIRMKTNTNITFNSSQSVDFLRKLGILLPDDPSRPGRLHVIPFKQVVGILPKISRTLSEKNEEWDLIESYDKKYFNVDWKNVLNEDKILQKGGWH